ncbi:MAG: hypothetical protein H6673_14440 [Anaerolineales bacterium]|nr:hypothetical protein [Anaerolineales bacterium]
MRYMIGVDGGATGTIAVLADEEGKVLHVAQASASNYIAVGEESAGQALRQVIQGLVTDNGHHLEDCIAATFGLAGLNNETNHRIFQGLIDPIGLGGTVHVENDIVIAWAAATACKPGVVVIAGTGSSAFGVNANGTRIKSLGWDYILADQGSGYWIGLQGIRAAIKAWDGRIDETPLVDYMVQHYQLEKAEDMLSYAYTPEFEKPQIASFSKYVSMSAEQGDVAAIEILKQAGDELGQAVCAVIKRLGIAGEDFTVGLIGGAFRSGEHLTDSFNAQVLGLAPKATIEPARYPPVIGAVIYSHYQNGTLTDEIVNRLAETGVGALRFKS